MRQNASYALTKRTARPCAGMLPAPFFLSQRKIFRFHRRRRVLAPKRFLRPNKEDGAALRRNAPAVPGKIREASASTGAASPCAETPRLFPAKKGKLSLPFSFAPALQLACQLPQPVHRVQPLPGQAGILAAEMAVVG